MTRLKDLDVSHNVLKRLPDVSYWTSDTLRKLNLAHNKVSIMCNNRERVRRRRKRRRGRRRRRKREREGGRGTGREEVEEKKVREERRE